jgi:hypothetical protein
MLIVFCHWLHTNSQLLPLILLAGEATFTRNRLNNAHNFHQWSHDNPHCTVETNFQRGFFISVWYSMIDNILIGLVILEDHMTGHNYLGFLQNGLTEQLEDVPLATWIALYFQHDRTSSYYT